MDNLTFPLEWLDLPDEQLALHVYALWLGYLAEAKGIPSSELTEEIAQQFTDQADRLTSGLNPELAQAIKATALGDPESAGKLLRKHFAKLAVKTGVVFN